MRVRRRGEVTEQREHLRGVAAAAQGDEEMGGRAAFARLRPCAVKCGEDVEEAELDGGEDRLVKGGKERGRRELTREVVRRMKMRESRRGREAIVEAG